MYMYSCVQSTALYMYSKACKKLHILDIILVHKNLFSWCTCMSTKPTEVHMYDNYIDLELPLLIDQIVAHE